MGQKDRNRLFPIGQLLVLSFLLHILSFAELTAQVANDECNTATNIFGDTYGQFFCLEGTTKGAEPDSVSFSPCFNSGFPTVWYKITDLYAELHFSLQVKGGEDDIFMLQL